MQLVCKKLFHAPAGLKRPSAALEHLVRNQRQRDVNLLLAFPRRHGIQKAERRRSTRSQRLSLNSPDRARAVSSTT